MPWRLGAVGAEVTRLVLDIGPEGPGVDGSTGPLDSVRPAMIAGNLEPKGLTTIPELQRRGFTELQIQWPGGGHRWDIAIRDAAGTLWQPVSDEASRGIQRRIAFARQVAQVYRQWGSANVVYVRDTLARRLDITTRYAADLESAERHARGSFVQAELGDASVQGWNRSAFTPTAARAVGITHIAVHGGGYVWDYPVDSLLARPGVDP
ncbi:MAG TPA: hypothetical protein VFS40_12655 [Gemmatimonadales bacterium]|nr:hypothetical protein [Gemmatimonadales bacterium]